MESERNFSSPEYRRSRIAYILYAMFEYFVLILMQDAFLAKLLSELGFEDSEIGIIASFVSLAFIFQFFSLFLAQKRGSKRIMIIVLTILGQMLFWALYILPLVNMDAGMRRFLVYVFIIGAYMSKYLTATFLFQWANSYVDPNRRGYYSANKVIVSLIGGIVFSLAMGAVFNWFGETDNIKGGFLFFSSVILVSNLLIFLCLILIKRERIENKETVPRKKLSDILKNTFGNKSFCHLVVIATLWKAAMYFTVGFMGTFKTDTEGNGLAMSVLLIQVIAIIGSCFQMAAARPFGKYSDKRSFAAGFYLSMFLAVAAFLCISFTTLETWFLVIGYTVLLAISSAGNDQNLMNMLYSYVNSEYIAEAMALQNCISGICGFLCSLLAGGILNAIQGAGNTFLGISLWGQQLLGVISAMICGVCIGYMKLTIMKEKVMKQ